MAAKITPNKLLTEFLRMVGDEETELMVVDGQAQTVSKAEAVARRLYQMALGGFVDVPDNSGQVQKVFIQPDTKAISLIREYTEGKPAVDTPKEAKGNKRPGSYDSSIKSRLQESLAINGSNTPNSKTRTSKPVPPRPRVVARPEDRA